MATTVVLGAGMAGLAAARVLHQAGRDVTVIDKGRGVGGRLATRRIGEGVFDHGAQFFTVRGDEFRALIDEAIAAGVVTEWCRGFSENDGYPRYSCPGGMTALAKWMAAGLHVQTSVHAMSVSGVPNGIGFFDDEGHVLVSADDAVITAPVPQMLALFDNGHWKLGHDLASELKSVSYFATVGLLALVDGQANVPEPGGAQYDAGPFTFVADNRRKGVSSVGALTFHADHAWSLSRYEDPENDVHDELLRLAQPWIGDASVIDSQLKKWRYAGPVKPLPDRTRVTVAGGARIALAGDAFGGPKVEGAFNSGVAAAHALLVSTETE